MENFGHEQVCRVHALEGDPAALGGAVTTELCGHWEHDGPCRWPHHTSTMETDADTDTDTTETDTDDRRAIVVRVRFSAPPQEVAEVRRRIAVALERGELVGPDGRTTTWRPASAP
jgi:hypothetical protein